MIITETFKNGGKGISTLLQEYVCLILKYKDENNEIITQMMVRKL